MSDRLTNYYRNTNAHNYGNNADKYLDPCPSLTDTAKFRMYCLTPHLLPAGGTAAMLLEECKSLRDKPENLATDMVFNKLPSGPPLSAGFVVIPTTFVEEKASVPFYYHDYADLVDRWNILYRYKGWVIVYILARNYDENRGCESSIHIYDMNNSLEAPVTLINVAVSYTHLTLPTNREV